MPSTWFSGVSAVFASQSPAVPQVVWEAIAQYESSMIPGAINPFDPGGGSYGLFQLNRSGQGAGQPISALLNPIKNAQLAAPSISKAYKEALYYGYTGNLAAEYTATHSGHPGYAPPGQILPAQGTVSNSAYAAFVKEAKGVAAAYNQLTKGSPSAGGFVIGPQGQIIPTGAGVGVPKTSQPSSPIGNLAGLPAPTSSSSWQHIISEVAATEANLGVGGFVHPGAALRNSIIFIVLLLLGLGIVFVGGKTLIAG